MRTIVDTLLSLYEWSYYIGLHPFFVAQIAEQVPERSNMYPHNEKCENVMFQYAWQNFDHLAREEIGLAIQQAEQLFADQFGYYPAPKYIANEVKPYPKTANRRDFPLGTYGVFPSYGLPYGVSGTNLRNTVGHFRAIQTKYGYIQTIGTETLTSLSTEAVVLTDVAGSGVDDTFTVTAAVPAGTTASEVTLFFVSADRGNLSLADCELRPISVSITANVATITGSVVLLVKPILQEALAPAKQDASTGAGYATTLSVYRRTTDVSDQGYLWWENILPCDNPPCDSIRQSVCWQPRNLELGFIAPVPATYDEDSAAFVAESPSAAREPDRATVNYLAGYPRQANGRMDQQHGRIIALLATALLPNKTCGCARADQRLSYYRDFPSDGAGNIFITPDQQNNPFGAGRGAIEAWNLCQPLRQMSSV